MNPPADQMPWEWLTNVVQPDYRRPGPKKTFLVSIDETRPFRIRAGSTVRVVEDLRPKLAPGAKVTIVLPGRMAE
jgi:hypothetical protein